VVGDGVSTSLGDSLEALLEPGRLILIGVKELMLSGFSLDWSFVADSLGRMTTMFSGTVLKDVKVGLEAMNLVTLLRICISGVRRWLDVISWMQPACGHSTYEFWSKRSRIQSSQQMK